MSAAEYSREYVHTHMDMARAWTAEWRDLHISACTRKYMARTASPLRRCMHTPTDGCMHMHIHGKDYMCAVPPGRYRRFATYLTQHVGAPPLCRVACGANADDYEWTASMMRSCRVGARWLMEALSVHLYASVRMEGVRASAADESAWLVVMAKGVCESSPPDLLPPGCSPSLLL